VVRGTGVIDIKKEGTSDNLLWKSKLYDIGVHTILIMKFVVLSIVNVQFNGVNYACILI
jgi:hypothetical protein